MCSHAAAAANYFCVYVQQVNVTTVVRAKLLKLALQLNKKSDKIAILFFLAMIWIELN